jgi:hypothetical protein
MSDARAIRLVIEWVPGTTQINVSGPVNDKTLCYGLLEGAKDAIRDHVKKQESRIVVAPASAVPS